MYKVVLYNKGKRKKTLKKYKLYTNALKKFYDILNKNKVYFPKLSYWDGSKTDFELAIIGTNKNKGKSYFRNELGGLVNIKPKGDFVIKKITNYYIEETFTDKLEDRKVTFKDVAKFIAKNSDAPCAVYPINNKLVIDCDEKGTIKLYILKNREDAKRLAASIKTFSLANDLENILHFSKPLFESRVKIYDILEEKYNIDRDYMQKISTR